MKLFTVLLIRIKRNAKELKTLLEWWKIRFSITSYFAGSKDYTFFLKKKKKKRDIAEVDNGETKFKFGYQTSLY